MSETRDEFKERAIRDRVRIVGDGWYALMERNYRLNWTGDHPERAWRIVPQSARSKTTGDRLAARDDLQERAGAWSHRTVAQFEKELDDGRIAYDFPKWPRMYGLTLYPALELVIAHPELHPDRKVTLSEISRLVELSRRGETPKR